MSTEHGAATAANGGDRNGGADAMVPAGSDNRREATPGNRARLDACEQIIARGLDTFVEVGAALAEIRERRLYRADGYGTFETYCKARWNLGRSRAYQFIAAVDVVEHLRQASTIVDTSDLNESHMRELGRIIRACYGDADAAVEALARARASTPVGQRVTARAIRDEGIELGVLKPHSRPTPRPPSAPPTTLAERLLAVDGVGEQTAAYCKVLRSRRPDDAAALALLDAIEAVYGGVDAFRQAAQRARHAPKLACLPHPGDRIHFRALSGDVNAGTVWDVGPNGWWVTPDNGGVIVLITWGDGQLIELDVRETRECQQSVDQSYALPYDRHHRLLRAAGGAR